METIKKMNILSLYVEDYQRYAIASNWNRCIPNIRDSLKPVQRKILYSMLGDTMGYKNNVKCAAIVGEVMKKFHPHGDASIYSSLVSIAPWYSEKEPLIDPYGNFGNMQGAGPAAMRYTEAKLSKFAKECVLGDIKSVPQCTDYIDNFDNTTKEPEYLPVKVPLLLINGAEGIGTGLATYIPSHNLREVIDATINYIYNPDDPVILKPDQCMKNIIIDTDWKKISNTGHGSFRVRSVIDIEDCQDKENKGCKKLVIRSLPDGVTFNSDNKNSIRSTIIGLSKTTLPQIKDITDDTVGNDLRINIILRKGSDPNYVKQMLYKKTLLEKQFNVNSIVISGLEPVRISYKAYIEFFVKQCMLQKFRLCACKYQSLKTKIHERELYIKVLESGEIDGIISMIRGRTSIDDNELMEYIIKKLNVSDAQAQFIITTDIRKLSKGYLKKYKEESEEMGKLADTYLELLTDDNKLISEIVKDLEYFKEKFGKPRMSKIVKIKDDNAIPSGEFMVIINQNNFIKKVQVGSALPAKDNPKFAAIVDNRDNLLLFSSKGKVFKYPVHKLPFMDKGAIGLDIRILIKGLTSDIVFMALESEMKKKSKLIKKNYLVVSTAGNCIKKIDLREFAAVPPSGIIYTRINTDDYVETVKIVDDSCDIIIYSNGKALRCNMSAIPLYKRISTGLLAMNTSDKIDGLSVINPDSEFIIVLTKNGRINKFTSDAVQTSDRNKAGNSVIKLSRNDSILSIHGAKQGQTLEIMASSGKILIQVDDIPVGSSISTGSKMVSTKSDSLIRSKII